MAYISLSQRDINVLEKIKDPESDPSSAIQVDPSLPKDPHIRDPETYEQVSRRERDIILSMQKLEAQNSNTASAKASDKDIVDGYRECLSNLDRLVQEYPQYASARNNRAQALRRLYGDSMLIADTRPLPQALLKQIDDSERLVAAKTVLDDLDKAITLLSPPSPYSKLSQQIMRTLSMAHTQRAAIYLRTSKLMLTKPVSVHAERPEAAWFKLDFEEKASADFAMGGRYGNQIAKGLAVSTNPTAKLCGQMVREAMKKEYGQDFVGSR